MNRKAWMIRSGTVLFSLMLLTCVPAFGHAWDFHQPESTGSLSAAAGSTGQAQFQSNANATLIATEVLSESPMLLAQKAPKPEGKKPKAEAGKTGDKASDASKKDDDDDEEEDEEEEDEDDDDEDKGKTPATKGEKAPKKSGS